MEDPSSLLNRVIQTDPIGSLPMLMPGAGSSKPGDFMMMDGYRQWGPADAFGDHVLQPFVYQKFPGGLMMQWGTTGVIQGYTGNGGGGTTSSNINFYRQFQSVCFGVYGNGTGSFTLNSFSIGGTGWGDSSVNIVPSAGFNFNNFTRYGFTISNITPVDMACAWFAVGY